MSRGVVSRTTASAWIVPLSFAALSALLFAPGLVLGQAPIFRDLLVLVIPIRHYAIESIRTGSLPLWTRDLFFGAPFLANYQSAVLYPPSAILYLLPFPAGLSAFLAFHLFVAGYGTARYLRRRLGLSAPAAHFGGVVFAFGGFFASLVPLTNQLEVAAWLPWAIEAAEELRDTCRPRWLAQLTLVFALQALGGAPEAWIATIALVVVSPFLSGRGWAGGARSAPWLLLAVALAAGLCGLQLLPTAEYALLTDRAQVLPFDSVAKESLTPSSFLQLLLPHAFSDGGPGFTREGGVPLFWSLYLGVAPLPFVILALGSARARFWIVILGAATLLALGPHAPLLGLLYRFAPALVGVFRFPAKFFLLAHWALALLAAEGLGRAMAAGRTLRQAVGVACVLALFGAGVALGASVAPEPFLRASGYDLPPDMATDAYRWLADDSVRGGLRAAGLGVAVAGLGWLTLRKRLGAAPFGILLSAITFVDLLWIHQPSFVFTPWRSLDSLGTAAAAALPPESRIFHYCNRSPSCVPAGTQGLGAWSGSLLPGESVERRGRDLWQALIPDAPMVYGLGAVAGSDGFATQDQREFFRALASLPQPAAVRLLASLSVDRLIGRDPLDVPGLRAVPVRENDPFLSYETIEAAPRAYVAERMLHAADTAAALALLGSSDFRPGVDAVIVSPPVEAEPASGHIEEARFSPNEVVIRATMRTAGLCVVSESDYPGWEATIDGTPAEILRVNGFVRGVRLPQGEHLLTMRFRPLSFRRGLWISAASMLLLLGSMALLGARRR